MQSPPVRQSGLVGTVLVVGLLLAAAAILVGPWRDERRLARADDMVQVDPARALREAAATHEGATRDRSTAVIVSSLVRLGDLDGAERVAQADVASHPGNPFAVRRLYQVQMLRSRRSAARRTLRTLRSIDPKYADGTGG